MASERGIITSGRKDGQTDRNQEVGGKNESDANEEPARGEDHLISNHTLEEISGSIATAALHMRATLMTAIRAFHLIIAPIDTCSVVIHSIGLSCFVSLPSE